MARRLAIIFSVLFVGVGQAAAASPDIVVSQVYGGGGNSGAPLTNDYIELYNRGATAVDVSSWSVQYASSAGSTWQRTNLTGTIQPGRYYLVRQAAGNSCGGLPCGVPLPSSDAAGSIAMSSTSGKVALVTNQLALTCGATAGNCFPNPDIRDFVGYGSSANNFEGAGPTATLSNTLAALRAANGCTDTDNNSADFAAGTPNPRNSASTPHFCGETAPSVATTTPANGASGVAREANISITFSEPVNLGGTPFGISCTSGSRTATQSGGPTTFTLDPTTDFAYSDACTVTVFASEVTDQDANDPPDNMTANYQWSFTVEAPPLQIAQVQGASHISPYNTQTVSGVEGVVTWERPTSFYMQDPTPDADVSTSEGILVFGTGVGALVNVGDAVRVGGRVFEFRPGGSGSANLTTTEITTPGLSVTVVSTGNPLPAATVIGLGGRVPPTTVIEDDATGDVETSGVFDPATDGIDFYESLEGMRVQVNDAVATGATVTFSNGSKEIPVLADDGANASVRTSRGGIVIRPGDFNPERMILVNTLQALPDVNTGDSFPGALEAIVDYSFGNFKFLVTTALAPVDAGLAKEVTSAPLEHEIAVATFNVENLDPGDPATKFERLAETIVENLRSPDLIAVEEVQDNDGPGNQATSTVTDASVTWNMLVAAIQAAGGPAYQWRQINPADDADGGEPGGNIRVGFLFHGERGLEFIDRPGGDATTATQVVPHPSGLRLTLSPGRVDPTDPAWSSPEGVRKPLAGEFKAHGKKLIVVANHWKSKNGDQPLFGRFQPPLLVTEAQRNAEAQVVNDFVDSALAADPNANVIVLGDLNDFEFSPPLTTLEGGGEMNTLIETLPQQERYSYVFDGNSQALDHIVVSDTLFQHYPFAYDIVHVNAEFVDQASDHDPQVVRFDLRRAAPN